MMKLKNGLSKYSILALVGLALFSATMFAANPFSQSVSTGSITTTTSSSSNSPILAAGSGHHYDSDAGNYLNSANGTTDG